MTQSLIPRCLRIGFGTLALLALLTATIAPVLAAQGRVEAVGLYMALEPLCHQRADRSWSFHDLQAGLCIRCYGVYSGIAAAALLGLPFTRRKAAAGTLAVGALWALEHVTLAPVFEGVRFAGGGALGLVAASVMQRRAVEERAETPGNDGSSNG